MRTSRLVALFHVLMLAIVAFGQSGTPDGAIASKPSGFPQRLQECELKECNERQKALWIFHGNKGTALWNISYGRLTVEQFDGTNVLISRADPAGTFSGGLTAVYKGKLNGSRFEGTVIFQSPGQSVSSPWYATIQPVPDDPVLAAWDFDCEPVPGMPAAIGNPLAAAKIFFDQKNERQAFCWTQTAALLYSSPKAQSVLALMYSNGIGVAPDIIEAFKWSEAAAAAGAPLPQEQRRQIANAAMMQMANVKPGATMNPLAQAMLGIFLGGGDGKWSHDEWEQRCGNIYQRDYSAEECHQHSHDSDGEDGSPY